LGKGDGTFQSLVKYGVGANPQGITVADFNGDGVVDLAIANRDAGTISVLNGRGDGTFLTAANTAAGTHPSAVAAAEMNGNGITDLAAVTSDANAAVLLNQSTTKPPAATHFSVKAPAGAMVGTAVIVTVTALTSGNSTTASYTGKLHFTSTDPAAALPA